MREVRYKGATNDENIYNHEYISILILMIYWKYQRNIGEYFFHKYRWSENYSKFIGMFGKNPKNDKISKNTYFKVIF